VPSSFLVNSTVARPAPHYTEGALAKYATLVSGANRGAVCTSARPPDRRALRFMDPGQLRLAVVAGLRSLGKPDMAVMAGSPQSTILGAIPQGPVMNAKVTARLKSPCGVPSCPTLVDPSPTRPPWSPAPTAAPSAQSGEGQAPLSLISSSSSSRS
jgi:hypothetical protein